MAIKSKPRLYRRPGQDPYGRRPGSLLQRRLLLRAQRKAQPNRIPGRPPAGWVLEHTHVIKGALVGVEVRILPHRLQFNGSLVEVEVAGGEVHAGPVVGTAVAVGARLEAIGARNVIDSLLPRAVVEPTLDDLQALQPRTRGIPQRPRAISR